jgi:hypothetical protein
MMKKPSNNEIARKLLEYVVSDVPDPLSCPASKYAEDREGSTEKLLSVEHFDVTIDGKLRCPLCEQEWFDGRGSFLHQYGVEAFFRDEDAQKGVHGYISGTDVSIGSAGNCGDTSRNPSSRRDGMIIYFECEWHGWREGSSEEHRPQAIVLELHIAQYKGDTDMYWIVKKYARRGNAPEKEE